MIHKMAKIGANTKFWYPELSNIGACIIGEDCVIHSHVWIADGVVIGNRVRIEAFSFLPPGVTIEDDAFIGPRVTFTNDKYPPSPDKASWLPTVIQMGASLGAGSIILPGVVVGPGGRVGAGAIVTKNVPAGGTWVGNPAHPIGDPKPRTDGRLTLIT